MEKKYRIVLIEDDASFGMVLKSFLEVHDFEVNLINDGTKALGHLRNHAYDLCIFDVMLPGVDGFSIAAEMRKMDSNTPMIFLTAKNMKDDILRGFSMGADDYITKPFDAELLLCKLKALLRRTCIEDENNQVIDVFSIGNYIFNVQFRTLELKGSIQKLSAREADLLALFCKNTNRVTSREQALKTLWGDDNYFTTRSMDVFITRLRKLLKDDNHVEITNLRGNGFILKDGK